jgi:hypothetical protein
MRCIIVTALYSSHIQQNSNEIANVIHVHSLSLKAMTEQGTFSCVCLAPAYLQHQFQIDYIQSAHKVFFAVLESTSNLLLMHKAFNSTLSISITLTDSMRISFCSKSDELSVMWKYGCPTQACVTSNTRLVTSK